MFSSSAGGKKAPPQVRTATGLFQGCPGCGSLGLGGCPPLNWLVEVLTLVRDSRRWCKSVRSRCMLPPRPVVSMLMLILDTLQTGPSKQSTAPPFSALCRPSLTLAARCSSAPPFWRAPPRDTPPPKKTRDSSLVVGAAYSHADMLKFDSMCALLLSATPGYCVFASLRLRVLANRL